MGTVVIKMVYFYFIEVIIMMTLYGSEANILDVYPSPYDCGPYGFTCEKNNRIRICMDSKPTGPLFICPIGTFCNEESTAVCEDAINHLDPTLTKRIRCQRNERIANPNVPGCKGYILCVPKGDRLQALNFKCSGNTVFNGITRTCTSPSKYKCPLRNITKSETDIFRTTNTVRNSLKSSASYPLDQTLPSIECKNYKFTVTQDDVSSEATYFCPTHPPRGHDIIKCTIFSNNFCITLVKDNDDQYLLDNTPYRRPRMEDERSKLNKKATIT